MVVSLEDAKRQVKIHSTDDSQDSYLNGLIVVAYEQLNVFVGRTIRAGTKTDSFQFNTKSITLPTGHILELSDVASGNLSLGEDNAPIGRLSLNRDYAIVTPENKLSHIRLLRDVSIDVGEAGAGFIINIQYDIGWADDDIPPLIDQAAQFIIGQLFNNSTDKTARNLTTLPINMQTLIAPYKVIV